MSNIPGIQAYEKHVRVSLVAVGFVAFLTAFALITRRSGMPVIFGRFSFELFAIILVLLLFSFSIGVIAVHAPIRVVTRILFSGAGLLFAIVLLDVSAYLLASVLPYQIWGQLPYQVKKMTYASRPEAVQLQQELVLGQDYWAFEPYKCTDWPVISGPEQQDVKLLPTYEVCHDEIGFRNPVGTYTENAFVDVVTLGDSFTYGYGSSRGWPDQLRERSGLTVLNLAQTGGSVPEWIGAFREYGMDKTPSIVIATTWDANDFVGLEVLGASEEGSGNQQEVEKILGVVSTIQGSSQLLHIVDYSLSASSLSESNLR